VEKNMEALTGITTVISTVGFPIAICLILLWYIYKLSEMHKSETKEFTEALNKNTLALQKLSDIISEGEDIEE
jgi:hypothetical protein